MVVRTIKITSAEADKLLNNVISCVFRTDKEYIRAGDIVQFLVIKDTKPVLHQINSRSYVVTCVNDSANAPIDRGFQLISVRSV